MISSCFTVVLPWFQHVFPPQVPLFSGRIVCRVDLHCGSIESLLSGYSPSIKVADGLIFWADLEDSGYVIDYG